jgi:hypothetical protein
LALRTKVQSSNLIVRGGARFVFESENIVVCKGDNISNSISSSEFSVPPKPARHQIITESTIRPQQIPCGNLENLHAFLAAAQQSFAVLAPVDFVYSTSGNCNVIDVCKGGTV